MNLSNTRTPTFRRNDLLEQLLEELSHDLLPAEERMASHYRQRKADYPFIWVMGPLRSGTTLFMQWLANTGIVAYPTNLLSRFYHAPIIGAKIQLLLTDPRYNFRDELGEFVRQIEYISENGKTSGVLAPNEFWYFWRRFLADPKRDVWSDEELRQSMDAKTMVAELVGISDVFQKPFAAKCMLFNYNIPFLDSLFDKVLFVQLKRDPITNVASILEARKRQLGSENAWYSFKIPEYPLLKDKDPLTQSAGQLFYINKAVTQGMSTLHESRKLIVEYEAFCKNPRNIFEQITGKLGMKHCGEYRGPEAFRLSRDAAVPFLSDIERAWKNYAG